MHPPPHWHASSETLCRTCILLLIDMLAQWLCVGHMLGKWMLKIFARKSTRRRMLVLQSTAQWLFVGHMLGNWMLGISARHCMCSLTRMCSNVENICQASDVEDALLCRTCILLLIDTLLRIRLGGCTLPCAGSASDIIHLVNEEKDACEWRASSFGQIPSLISQYLSFFSFFLFKYICQASDVEDALCLSRAMLRAYPNVTLTNKMLDAHLYIFSRWVLDLIEVLKEIKN